MCSAELSMKIFLLPRGLVTNAEDVIKPNGISYIYHLDQSISFLRVVWCFSFYSNLNRKLCQNTGDPGSALFTCPKKSSLGLYGLN